MREYIITTGGTGITGASSLIAILASGAPRANLEFLRWWIGYSPNATSGQQRVTLVLNSGAVTGSAYTPQPLKEVDAASSITGSTIAGGAGIGRVTINASTEAGARTIVHEDAFNVLNGWLYVPTPPETRIQPAGATSAQGMYLPSAPTTTASGWSWGMHYREV